MFCFQGNGTNGPRTFELRGGEFCYTLIYDTILYCGIRVLGLGEIY